MEDILNETESLAKEEVSKREKISEKELNKRASAIAIAAIFYGDLKNYRSNDIIFDIERFLSFEGDTGPYLLYSYARARSILKKAGYAPKKKYKLKNLDDYEKNLILKLQNFPEVVNHAYAQLAPNIIANYSFSLAQIFNEFYHSDKVIGSEEEQFRLILVDAFSQVLKNSLSLLGISAIENM
jgi:arginyl-tRNA synthetase